MYKFELYDSKNFLFFRIVPSSHSEVSVLLTYKMLCKKFPEFVIKIKKVTKIDKQIEDVTTKIIEKSFSKQMKENL